MTQAVTLPLLRGTTTLEAALEEEENMLLSLAYPEQRLDFFVWLNTHRQDIEDTVSYHLGLTGLEICRLGEVREWIHGSFNVCIPVYVDNWSKHPGRRVIIRFPLPYKIGESACPGNAEEKLRCEAATFIWIQEHCPHVPIPHLWGFGFVGGQSVWDPNTVLSLPPKLIQTYIVYQTRERTFENQTDLVPSTTHIIAVRIYTTLSLYKPPPSISLRAWISGHGLYRGYRRKDAFRDMGRISTLPKSKDKPL
jgi:hypothetical protein